MLDVRLEMEVIKMMLATATFIAGLFQVILYFLPWAAIGVGIWAVKRWFKTMRRIADFKERYGDDWRLYYDLTYHPKRGWEELSKRGYTQNEVLSQQSYKKPQYTNRSDVRFTTRTPETTYSRPGTPAVSWASFTSENSPIKSEWFKGSTMKDRNWFAQYRKYWKVSSEQLAQNPAVHGTPGAGLDNSGFSQGAIHAGQKGEENLAKLMMYNGIMSNGPQTFWSLALPDSKFDTDVDCAVVYGNTLYLIDAKNYKCFPRAQYGLKKGTNNILVAYNPDGSVVPNSEHTLSKSMTMAMDKYREYMPADVNIAPVIVMCPGHDGEPGVRGNTMIHNRIPVMSSVDFVRALNQESKGKTADPRIVNMLTPLLKHSNKKEHVQTPEAIAQTMVNPVPAPISVLGSAPVQQPVPVAQPVIPQSAPVTSGNSFISNTSAVNGQGTHQMDTSLIGFGHPEQVPPSAAPTISYEE